MKITCLLSGLIVLFSLAAHGGTKPNVVFILADDLGYGDLGCYGATHIPTPAVDRLALEGMRFTDAHSPAAVCSPTRYAVLTGRYCWRSWLKNWVLLPHHPLLIDTQRLTMGKLFKKAGYATGCIGKWHLGWGNELNPDFSGEVKPGPLEVGFDYFYGLPFSHNCPKKALMVYMLNRRIVNLPEGLRYDSKEAMRKTVRRLEDTATQLSKQAVAFIEKHKNKPFFLYYPTANIHWPETPHKRFRGKSRAGKYGDFVVEFDWAVSEVLAALERNGLSDNTIVIVTSDNGSGRDTVGEHQCNGHLRGKKTQIYEGGHRVPLIVRWPQHIKAGTTSRETVCLTDFFATFADILEQSLPRDAGEDSYSMRNVLLGKPYRKPLREATVHHSVCGMFAIRRGAWKLIEGSGDGMRPRGPNGKILEKNRTPERDAKTGKWTKMDYFQWKPDGRFQLYNLAQDPTEQKDLALECPEKVKALYSLLNRYRKTGRSTP